MAQLGAEPVTGRIHTVAAQTHIHLDEPAPSGAADHATPSAGAPDGLTRREREVLAQIAAGRTYAEIARALFISEKTVSVHVSNMLRKTGARSRIDLAALVPRTRQPEPP